MASATRHTTWVEGSGALQTQSRQVEDFTAVSLEGTGEVIIRRTGVESLSITADENLLPLLTSTVEGDTLALSVEDGVNFHGHETIRYDVTVKELSGVDLSGSGTIVASDLDGGKLRVTLSGSGTIAVSGVVDKQVMGLSGSGVYEASGLQSRRADITISGTGDATVAVSDRLDVTISGVGKVRYAGDPDVRKSISGMGRVVHAT